VVSLGPRPEGRASACDPSKPTTEASPTEGASKPKSTRSLIVTLVAIGVGGVVTVLVSSVVPLVAGIFAGSLFVVVLVRRSAPQSYGLAGALYLVTIGVLTAMPALSTQSPDLVRWSLLIVGGLYATFLAVKYGVKVLLRRAGRRYANTETLSELWDVAVSSWSVIYILWHAVHLLERVFRSIALSILGPGSMATNIVFAGTGAGTSGILLFDVSFVIFVVCVMLGFHTLATWYSAAKLTESVSTDAKSAHAAFQRRVGSRQNRASQGSKEGDE